MTNWSIVLEVKLGRGPVFLRIAEAVVDQVRRGTLRPGQRLPGSRALAKALAVHRNTVLAALAELEAQGWVTTVRAKGTFIADTAPDAATQATPKPKGTRLGFSLPMPGLTLREEFDAFPPGMLALSGGSPDARQFPVDALARAWRRVVRRSGRRLLEYGHPAGHPELRRGLADMVSAVRAVPATADRVMVTRGSQMALALCARALLRPGDAVAVEALGYRPAWDALRLAGAQLLPVAVDEHGLDVEALERLARRRRLRAVYVTPHHQYPTTTTLTPRRRQALLELARRHQLCVLEDDYDHEFHYASRPVLPLASDDAAGVVVYLGTLSKVLAPGLRLGFVVAPPEVVERLAMLRGAIDRQGDTPMEAAVAELIDDGLLQRHVRTMRGVYRARRDALVDALQSQLGEVLDFEVPSGGLAVWARWRGRPGFSAWVARCLEAKVWLPPGQRFTFDGAMLHASRLGFARHTPAELRRAVELMAAQLR